MRAEATYGDTGSKFGKIAIVTALHLGAALALFNMKTIITVVHPPVIDLAPLPAPVDPPALPDPPVLPTEKLPDLTPPPFHEVPVSIDDPVAKPQPPTVIAERGPIVDGGPPVTGGTGVTSGGGGGQVAVAKPDQFKPVMTKDCVLPEYPKTALRNGDTGTVSLALLINANGQVAESKVQKSSGFRDLDRAAVAALSMCKFTPAMSNGVAQPAWGQLAYVWRLD